MELTIGSDCNRSGRCTLAIQSAMWQPPAQQVHVARPSIPEVTTPVRRGLQFLHSPIETELPQAAALAPQFHELRDFLTIKKLLSMLPAFVHNGITLNIARQLSAEEVNLLFPGDAECPKLMEHLGIRYQVAPLPEGPPVVR